MTALMLLGVAAAGGLGAALRYAVDTLVRARYPGVYPLGTLLINVSGSFLIGLLTAAVSADGEFGVLQTVLATGLLGGYTTFSTASFETVRLAQRGHLGLAVMNALGMLAAALLAATGGLLLGSWLVAR